jgi:RNA 2',3'-cyclic 3'-phosphodiesterase
MRLFIAIPLPTQVSEAIAAFLAHVRSSPRIQQSEALRWSAPDAWHITLQFLGKSTAEQHDCLIERLRTIREPAVPTRIDGVGTFERAGVFFAKVEPAPQLLALQQAITTATQPCGFAPEDRPYNPHITLARRKGNSGRNILPELIRKGSPALDATFTAECFVLYESTPTAGGSRYDIRATFPLTQ